jgi:hypothetical protein
MPTESNAAELLKLLGADAFARLVANKGGQRVHVPVKALPSHFLSNILGMQAFANLVDDLGGFSIVVPNGVRTPSRFEHVHKLVKAGLKINDIAEILGMTERSVYRHKRMVR